MLILLFVFIFSIFINLFKKALNFRVAMT